MGVQQQQWRKSFRANNSGQLSYSGINQTGFALVTFLIFIIHQAGGHVLLWAVAEKKINYQTKRGLNWRQIICSGFFMLWLGSRFRCNSAETGFLYFVIQDTWFPRQSTLSAELSHINCTGGCGDSLSPIVLGHFRIILPVTALVRSLYHWFLS